VDWIHTAEDVSMIMNVHTMQCYMIHFIKSTCTSKYIYIILTHSYMFQQSTAIIRDPHQSLKSNDYDDDCCVNVPVS
jgi:hypothetical protein